MAALSNKKGEPVPGHDDEATRPTGTSPASPSSNPDEEVRTPRATVAAGVEATLDVLDAVSVHLGKIDKLRDAIAALLVENKKLKADNIRLAKALVSQGRDGGDRLATLTTMQEKLRVAQTQVGDLMEENTESNSRILELEELNGSMMSMYVSSFQLHATLDTSEVVKVIEEILVNFIGARAYAILLCDDDATFRVVAEGQLAGRLPKDGILARGVLAEVVGSLTAYVHTSTRPAREGILAAVPLAMGKSCVGAILVYDLLAQKDRLLKNDMELFSLLGGHAASAIVSARLYAKADRKLKTLEAMLGLLEKDPG